MERKKYLRERDIAQKRVERAVAKDGKVQLMPINTDVLHAEQRGVAGSVAQTKVTSWLESEEGRKWQDERKALFRGDGEDLV